MFDSTSLNKDVMNTISDLIKSSLSKEEVFQETISKYPHYDQESIAKGITAFISSNVKEKYKIHAYILSLFLLVSLFFAFISPPHRTDTISLIFYWSGRLIFLVIAIYFIRGFINAKLWYYTTAISYYSLYILVIAYNWFVFPFSIQLILSTGLIITTFIYLYLLRSKMFPNINFWGNVKKVEGKYIF